MQPRTRAAIFLGVALIAAACFAACFASCDGDDAPPPAEPGADAAVPEAVSDATARRVRPRRRRAGRADPTKRATDTGVLFDDAGWLTQPPPGAASSAIVSGADQPGADAAPLPAEPPPTGRVRVLMLKDGRPFEGGHVCFYPEDVYLEAKAWDGTACSDGAYLGLPMYTAFWPRFEPVLGSADGDQRFELRARGVTGQDGVVTLDLPAGRSLVPYVRYRASGIPLVSQPRVNVAAGGDAEMTIEAAPMRTLTGRCVDSADRPLPGIWVQAISRREERPLSQKAETSATGTFQLEVFGVDRDVRVRAVVPYVAHPLGIYDAESDVPAIPAETTIAGVVPGAWPLEIRMPDAPLVFIELTVAEGEPPLSHLQIEGLAFDPHASAWGRLGGPQYRRTNSKAGGRRAVIALPRAEAARPLMLWSWGWTITAVDPRGADRVSVEIPRGRRTAVRGRGWKDGDRLRVVCFCGPEGQEIPCIWIDGVVGKTNQWSRDDAPVCAIEFQIVRDGVVTGRSARIPPGTGPATEVSIDLE